MSQIAPSTVSIANGSTSLVPRSAPQLIRYSHIAPQPIEWLWKDRIAIGKLTLLVGEPGLGKGLLTIDLAARVSHGGPWPGEPTASTAPATALLLHAEDDAHDTVHARLSAAGADLDRILTVQLPEAIDAQATDLLSSGGLSLSEGLTELDAALCATPDCRLVVLDPITAFLGPVCGNQNHAVRALLTALGELARRRRVAMVAVAHLNKQASQRAVLRVMGALSFVATARSVWSVVRDPEKPDERLMLSLKTNLTQENIGLRFTLPLAEHASVPRVQWAPEPVTMSLQAFCDHRLNRADREYINTEHYVAERLKEELSDGPISRQVLQWTMLCSEEQLYRAAQRLGVIKVKDGFETGWTWMLPEHHPAWRDQREKTRERQMRRRLARKNEQQRSARAARKNAKAPGSNSEASSGNGTHPKPTPAKSSQPKPSPAGNITPELAALLAKRFPGVDPKEAMERAIAAVRSRNETVKQNPKSQGG